MSTKTTNYSIIKPVDNESADIQVINANMDIIDAKLKEVDNKASNITIPVTKVNNKTGDVVLTAADVGAVSTENFNTFKTANETTLADFTKRFGKIPTVITDIHAALDTGIYMGSTVANAPTAEWFIFTVNRHNALYATVTAHSFTGLVDNIYTTFCSNGVWKPWRKVLTQSDYDMLQAGIDECFKPSNYGAYGWLGQDWTLTLAYANMVIAGGGNITIPANVFPSGTQITFINWTTGVYTFIPASGVSLLSKDNKRVIDGAYASATLIAIGSNQFVLIGALK